MWGCNRRSQRQGEAPGREKVFSHVLILPIPIKLVCPFLCPGHNNLKLPEEEAGGRGMLGSGAPATCSVAESIVWFMKVRVQSRQTFFIRLETG